MNHNKIPFKELKGAKLALAIIGTIMQVTGILLFLVPFFFAFVMFNFDTIFSVMPLPFFGMLLIIIGNVLLSIARKEGNSFLNQDNTPYQNIDDGIYHPSRNPNVERLVSCPACKKFVNADSSFCSQCGARLSKFCKYCGNENEGGASYCQECGKKLDD